MNYLPIIILVLFLFRNNNNFSGLLDNINFEDIMPTLSLLGVDESIISALQSDEFKEILNGNINLKTLIPLVMPLLSSFKQPENNSEDFKTYTAYTDLTPIKDVAGQNITTALEEYFS